MAKLLTLLPLLAVSTPALAQTPAPTQTPTPKPPAPMRVGSFTLSVSNRTRIESFRYFQGEVGAGSTPASTAGDGKYATVGNLLRLNLSKSTPDHDVTLEFAQPSLLNLPNDALASGPGTAGQGALGLGSNYYTSNGSHQSAFGFFPKQAFVRFKNLGSPGNSARIGRFEFSDGAETIPANPGLAYLKRERVSQRLIGPFGFSAVGRSFDGAQLVSNTPRRNLTFAAARATEGVFQVRGTGELDVDFAYGALTLPRPNRDFRVFGALYRDGRDAASGSVKVDNRPLAARQADSGAIRVSTLGAHYLQTFPTEKGAFDLLAWGALQGGDWGAQSHRANALALEAGFQPGSAKTRAAKSGWHPCLRAGYFKSSGDSDATDGKHETYFQMLPTPRVYARFPFFNQMNNEDLFAQLMLRRGAKTTVRFDAHRLRLSETNDLFYSGGGAYQDNSFGYAGRPSLGGKGLSNLFDVSVDHQLNAHTSLGAYLAYAPGGAVLDRLYTGNSNALFGYLEMTRRF